MRSRYQGRYQPRSISKYSAGVPRAQGGVVVSRPNLIGSVANVFNGANWFSEGTLTPNFVANPVTGAVDAWRWQGLAFQQVNFTIFGLPAGQYTEGIWIRSRSGTPTIELGFDYANRAFPVTSGTWQLPTNTATLAGGQRALTIQPQADFDFEIYLAQWVAGGSL